MKVMELFVDCKDIDTEDGYSLFIDEPYEMAMAVKTALKNGFTDIRIRPADKKDLAECNLIYKTDFDIDLN